MTREAVLPIPLAPRLVRRINAAAYIGTSPTKFDELVRDGRMPRPKRIDGRVVWDVRELDAAVDDLPSDGEPADNPWDTMP